MPIFVALGKATEQGVKNLGGFGARHEQAVKRAEGLGGKVIGSYALLGHYDYLVILDCPDEKTALRILLGEAQGGNIRYETLTAIPTDEFAKLISKG